MSLLSQADVVNHMRVLLSTCRHHKCNLQTCNMLPDPQDISTQTNETLVNADGGPCSDMRHNAQVDNGRASVAILS